MDINAFEEAANDDGDLEYDQEQDQIQVNNPVQKTLQDIAQQKNQIANDAQEEEQSEEPSAAQADHTPSFFSQRFASDLINGRLENQENINDQNLPDVQFNSMIKKVNEADCSLNVNTFQMRQLLGQEKMAPEILPYQHALVETICKQINSKDREINLRATNKGSNKTNNDERFYLNILRMEMERVKYLLKSYLRSRIVKIEKHLLFIVEKDQAHLLSEAEMEYAWTQYESKKKHYQTELFDRISKKLNCMEEGQDIQDSMITKPNPRQFVFVRFLISKPKLTIMGYIDIAIKEENIYYLPFDQVKSMLEQGQAELI